MTQLRWQTHVGFAVESSGWGVAAPTAALFVPCEKSDFKDDIKYYKDTAYRSVQAKDFGAYPTVATGDFSFDTDVYVDTLPVLLGVGMIGDNDVVTIANLTTLNIGWTNGTVNAHNFILQPAGPKSLTIFDYNGYSERAYSGARLEEVQFKYSPDGAVKTMYKGKSRLSTLVSGSYVPVIGTYAPILGWQALLTLNGATNTRLIDADITFKRGLEVLFTQAQTQAPTNIYAFPLEVTGKITVDFQDETEYNLYRTGNQSASFVLTFVSSSTNAIQLTIPQPLYTAYNVDRGKEYLTAVLDFSGIYNQATSTNVKLVVYNSQTAAY